MGWISQKAVDMPSIIGGITITAGHHRFDRPQQALELAGIIRIRRRQFMGGDFLGIRIEAQVQFTPSASGRPTTFAHLTPTFAVGFQSRRNDQLNASAL